MRGETGFWPIRVDVQSRKANGRHLTSVDLREVHEAIGTQRAVIRSLKDSCGARQLSCGGRVIFLCP